MESNFCAFILTHGRPDNVRTYHSLMKHGYTGKLYFVIDNEDKMADAYYRKFGSDRVIMFDKKEVAGIIDEADNFENRKAIIYARNACFYIAKKLGVKYFVQLDDDYTSFLYRYIEGGKMIKNIDNVFKYFVQFLETSNITSVAFSQGGDHIGGYDDTKRIKRKAMNSFFCSVDRPFKFNGRINEDVNTYVHQGGVGRVFLTITNIQLNQFATQSNKGGMTDIYLDGGTYVKSFYSVLFSPSCVSINTMGRSARRLHHSISWDNAVPAIIEDKYRSKDLPPYEVVFENPFPDNDKVIVEYKPTVSEFNEKFDKELLGYEEEFKNIIQAEPQIEKPEYEGEYGVSFSYELKELDTWNFPIRAKGSKLFCERYIEFNKPKL